LAQSLGGGDNGGSLRTLLYLLERDIGSCLEAVVAMTPKILGAIFDLVSNREQQIGGSGGSIEPPGPLS
jgi:hypothetical protein